MAYKLRILPQDCLCLLAYSGKVEQADFEGIWRDVAVAEGYRPDMDDLVVLGPDADFSDIAHHMSIEQAQKFVEARDAAGTRRRKHSAFVCGTEMQVVMTRMFSAYVLSLGSSDVCTETLRDLDGALDWIGSSRDDGPPIDAKEVKRQLREMGHGWCCGEAAA